jgi:hypothetical protein
MISYAQNREDVVLWRALSGVGTGLYAEIGGDDGQGQSMTRAFYERGWQGLALVNDEKVADARRRARADEVVEAVSVDDRATRVSGALERSRHAGGDLHLLVVDRGGHAGDALLVTAQLQDWRPWVLVVTNASPDPADQIPPAWEGEVLAVGYERCLFDGVSRFYVAADRAELRPALSYPACIRDEFTDRREAELADDVSRLKAAVQQARDESLGELLRWRHAAVSTWAKTAATRASGATPADYQELQVALAAAQRDAAEVRQTLSWRVTKPLRMVKSAGRRQ